MRTGIRSALTGAVSALLLLPFCAQAQVSSGVLSLTFWINTVTGVPSGENLVCTLYATVVDGSGATITEREIFGSTIATISNAGSAYCTVNLPYTWSLVNASADTVVARYTVGFRPASSTLIITHGSAGRDSSGFLQTIPVPANGTTTVLSPPAVTVRL